MTSGEHAILRLLGQLRERPETSVRFLKSFPNLEAKVQAVGGLDAFISARYNSPRDLFRRANQLVRQAESDTAGSIRERLSTLEDSGNPHVFLMIAERLCDSDDAKGSAAIEVASRKISELENPIQAASLFENLIRTSLRCQGEIDSNTLTRGSNLVKELRSKAGAGPRQGARVGGLSSRPEADAQGRESPPIRTFS